jgi:cytochrome c-type biogenesis protein
MKKLHLIPASNIPLYVSALLSLLLSSQFGVAEPPVRSLPQFQIRLIDGTVLKSKNLIGKVTVIDFWGTWCPPCIEEIPAYNAFYKEYKGKVVGLYALAVESGTEKELREAVKRLKIEYPVAAPSSTQLDAFGDIPVFPTTWIINPQGSIEKEFLGSSPSKQRLLRGIVDRLLKESAK